MKKPIRCKLKIVTTLLCLFSACMARAGVKMQLGSQYSVLEKILPGGAEASRTATLVASSSDQVEVEIAEFHRQDGKLSLSGTAKGQPNSKFLLKSDGRRLSGWLVLRDKDLAYKYSTDEAGGVTVEAVPVTRIFPVCNIQKPASIGLHAPTGLMSQPEGKEPHVGDYKDQDLFKLESLPGSKKVIYMDITRAMSGSTPKYMTKVAMWKTWQSVASGLSMYEVNVTTNPFVYKAAGVVNSAIARFYDQDGQSFAYLDGFGSTEEAKIFRAPEDDQLGYGLTVLHEVGHLLGLSHDGDSREEYFEGIRSFQWIPIMGNYYMAENWAQPLYQWSKGEYTSANETEDDFRLMGSHLEFRVDDITQPIPLLVKGVEVTAEFNRGQIAMSNDSDTFTFRIESREGRVKLKIDRTEIVEGAMLDVEAGIRDSFGKSVARSNKTAIRYAEFDLSLPKGNYFLDIKGGAEGTSRNGFSSYSSQGFYAIQGQITGGAVVAVRGEGQEPLQNPNRAFAGNLANLGIRGDGAFDAYSLISADGKVARVWRRDGSAHAQGRLPAGNYFLRAGSPSQVP